MSLSPIPSDDPKEQLETAEPESGDPKDERVQLATASQRQLIWMRFRRHKMAMIGLWILILMYFVAALAGFFAPFTTNSAHSTHAYHPPQLPNYSTSAGFYFHASQARSDIDTPNRRFAE